MPVWDKTLGQITGGPCPRIAWHLSHAFWGVLASAACAPLLLLHAQWILLALAGSVGAGLAKGAMEYIDHGWTPDHVSDLVQWTMAAIPLGVGLDFGWLAGAVVLDAWLLAYWYTLKWSVP